METNYATAVSNYSGPSWHVCKAGSDSTGDGSITNPFETIQHAINSANSADTVFVADGVFYENISFSKNLTLIGSGIQHTIIDASYSGFGINAFGSSIIVHIEGFSVRHVSSGFAAITVNGNYHNATVNAKIRNNEVYDNNNSGIYIVNDHHGTSHIEYNLIHNNSRPLYMILR